MASTTFTGRCTEVSLWLLKQDQQRQADFAYAPPAAMLALEAWSPKPKVQLFWGHHALREQKHHLQRGQGCPGDSATFTSSQLGSRTST